jgi:hypothetical protein
LNLLGKGKSYIKRTKKNKRQTRLIMVFFSMMVFKVLWFSPWRSVGIWSQNCTIKSINCPHEYGGMTYHESKVPRCNGDVRPHLSAILIPALHETELRSGRWNTENLPFIGRGCSERDDQTEHGTQNTQEGIRNLKLVRGQLRNQGDHYLKVS